MAASDGSEKQRQQRGIKTTAWQTHQQTRSVWLWRSISENEKASAP